MARAGERHQLHERDAPGGANKGKPPGAAPQPKDEIWADIKSPTAVVEKFGMRALQSLLVGKSLGRSGGERG